MPRLYGEEELQEATWLGEDEPRPDGAWRRHLIMQLQRSVVVSIIILVVLGMRASGTPGRWVLSRLSSAVNTDMSNLLEHVFDTSLWLEIPDMFRQWLKRGPLAAGSTQQSAVPPRLQWPIEGGQFLASAYSPGLGLKILTPIGTPVRSAAAGTVLESRLEEDGSISLILSHQGDWFTVYERCLTILVEQGEMVGAGEAVALVGSSSPPTPSHLRFELWGPQGQIDPRPLMTTAFKNASI